ncbi:unnamed protein product [Parajaminaea phylloscopi]
MPQLIDRFASEELLIAAIGSIATTDGQPEERERLFRSVRVVSALLHSLPTSAPGRTSAQRENAAKVDELADVLCSTYSRIDATSTSLSNHIELQLRVAVLDCAAAQLARALREDSPHRVTKLILTLSGQAAKSSTSSRLLADLVSLQPALFERVVAPLRSSAGSSKEATQALALIDGSGSQQRQAGQKTVDARADTVSPHEVVQTLAGLYRASQPERTLQDSERNENVTQTDDAIPASLLSLLEAVLPDLARDGFRLRRMLQGPKYRGKSEEEIVGLLLDEPEQGSGDDWPTEAEPVHKKREMQQPVEAAPKAQGKARANIFDEQPLDATRLKWNRKKDADHDDTQGQLNAPLPDTLRSAILARVKAQNSEAQEAGEEWNPFAALDAGAHGQEVGFEEEVDDSETEALNRRLALSNIGGPRGNARDYVRRLEDFDSSSTAEDSSEPEDSQHRSATATPSGAAQERESERLMILAYSRHGAQIFEKTSAARSSAARKRLREDLQGATGRTYDDALIESWGTMFDRNPRKDALLSSASSFDLLAGGNPNVAPSADGFGPDKRKGGRPAVSTGSNRGSARGGRGGGPGASGHSGNNRAARNKERRGNVQRTRGADRKARAMGGPADGA